MKAALFIYFLCCIINASGQAQNQSHIDSVVRRIVERSVRLEKDTAVGEMAVFWVSKNDSGLNMRCVFSTDWQRTILERHSLGKRNQDRYKSLLPEEFAFLVPVKFTYITNGDSLHNPSQIKMKECQEFLDKQDKRIRILDPSWYWSYEPIRCRLASY